MYNKNVHSTFIQPYFKKKQKTKNNQNGYQQDNG